MTKKAWIFTFIVGQAFIWTGSAFISVLYRLYDFFEPRQAALFTEVLYYTAQAAGIAAYSLLLKFFPKFAGARACVCLCLAAAALPMALALLVDNGAAVMVFGLIMNIGIGTLSGVYLTRLSAQIPQQCRGRVFGVSYAVGSVGTWLLSLPLDGKLLRSEAAVWIFLGLAAISAALVKFIEPIDAENSPQNLGVKPDKRLILLALALPLMCSAVNSLGYYFDAADLSGVLDPAFTRLFYSVGLIVSGIVNDKDRRLGAAACLTALIFPFVSLALRNEAGISAALSIFSYIFYGFFSVYRVVLFADIASGKQRPPRSSEKDLRSSGVKQQSSQTAACRRKGRGNLPPLAVFGLMTGRLGDALGTLGGIFMGEDQILLTCVTAVMFIASSFIFFALYQKLYAPRMSERENKEAKLDSFGARYGFTSRQSEILRLVLDGASNAEISGKLFLSENTVKFHMKNILSKTSCANRSELLALFKAEKD